MAAAPPRPPARPVTIHDVARLAGVSAMTVSRVLNTPDAVTSLTRAKVQAAIGESGYVSNRLAGGLRSSRSGLVAAVVPTLNGPVFLETIAAMTSELDLHGYQLMVGQTGYESAREDQLVQSILGRRPDGLILTGVFHSASAQKRLRAAGIPVVETWDLSPKPLDVVVGFSHERVGQAVADHLSSRGRRRLAVIGADDPRSLRRAKAFALAAAQSGLPAPITRFVPAPAHMGDGRRALRELLAQAPEVDGIFCSSDLLALGVLTEARASGVRVPGQVAVVGFGDLNFAKDADPALTTVRINGREIGETAARCIVSRARGLALDSRVIDVGFSIVERDST